MLIALAGELDTSVSQLLGELDSEKETNDLKAISGKLEVINLQLANISKARTRTIRGILIGICIVIVLIFMGLYLVGDDYRHWDYSDPEVAIAGTLWHGFAWFFGRLAPLVFIGCVIGLLMTWRKKDE